jgi:pimeloyl-ACP methyl ester carboxylesterase
MNAVPQFSGVDVLVEGHGDESIVMVHGWPDTYRLWDAQVAHFKDRYRCVRFTLPGFDIARPRRAWTLDETVALLRDIIQGTCAGGKVVLMVHDWGCLFGYQLAMRHPELVQRIVGVDIGDSGSRDHVQELSAGARTMIVAYQWWLAAAWRIGGGLGERMTRWMVRKARCPTDLRHIGSQMNYPYDIQWTGSHGSYRHRLPFEPTCPMLFVFGTRKPFMFHSTAWADALAAQPGCEVVAMKTGHWLMCDDPQGFNLVVQRWLSR